MLVNVFKVSRSVFINFVFINFVLGTIDVVQPLENHGPGGLAEAEETTSSELTQVRHKIPNCVKQLNKKYLSTYTEEDTQKSRLLLKSDCETYKAEAESCCSNPNSCNNFVRDLTQHLLPLAPALYQTISAYNTSKDIASEKLTPEEAGQKNVQC